MRYNHFHDQLVLTSSSDARLVLTSVASISSEPDGHLGTSEDDIDSKKGRQVICLYLFSLYVVVKNSEENIETMWIKYVLPCLSIVAGLLMEYCHLMTSMKTLCIVSNGLWQIRGPLHP